MLTLPQAELSLSFFFFSFFQVSAEGWGKTVALPILFFFPSLCLRTSGASMLWKRDLKFGRVGTFLVEINPDLVKLLASGKHGRACSEELGRGEHPAGGGHGAGLTSPRPQQQPLALVGLGEER